MPVTNQKLIGNQLRLVSTRGYVGATFARGSVVATLVIREFSTKWLTVQPERVIKRNRQLVPTSPAMSGTAAKRTVPPVLSPLPHVLPSSTSPDYSENSDSSEDPTYIPVETSLPVIPSSQSVVSNQLPVTEPAPIMLLSRLTKGLYGAQGSL